MKRFRLLFILTACIVSCQPAPMKVQELPAIPDPAYAKGVSAPFCGVAGEVLFVAGGANFPDKPLLEGGAKKVYADIWAWRQGWVHAGVLPDSTAYGATFQVDDALILAGGNDGRRSLDTVYELSWQEGGACLRPLPPLPVPMEQAGWTRCGNRLYLAGGVGTTGVYTCNTGEYAWTKLTDLPMPLVQPVLFASGERLYVWGGFHPETLELPQQAWVWDGRQWTEGPGFPDGGTFVGATGVSLPDGRLAVVGGVDRAIFARALHNTPEDRIPYLSQEPAAYRFRRTVYLFDPDTESWSRAAEEPFCALAGPGVAVNGKQSLYVAGGEIKPGVRSPRIFSLNWP